MEGISLEKACEIALNYYKESGHSNIEAAKDLGDKWLIYPKRLETEFDAVNITVDKASGKIELFNLPDINNFKLLESAIDVDLPEEYRN